MNSQCAQSSDFKNQMNGVDRDILKSQYEQTYNVNDKFNNLQKEMSSQFVHAEDIGQRSNIDLRNLVYNGQLKDALASKDIQRDILKTHCQSNDRHSDHFHKLSCDIRENKFHQEKRFGDLQKEVITSSNKIQLQAVENQNQVLLENQKNREFLALQAQNNYTNVQLDALKNKNCLSKQINEVLCAVNKTVVDTSNNTQNLIRDFDSQRLRDKLHFEQTENLLLRRSRCGSRRRC